MIKLHAYQKTSKNQILSFVSKCSLSYLDVYVFIHIQGFIDPDLHNIFLGERVGKSLSIVVKLENVTQLVHF